MKWLDLPPVWLAVFLALSWAVTKAGFAWSAGEVGIFVGCVLVAVGGVLMLLTAVAFHRAKTTIIPHQHPSALVTSGILRISRNPIYLGDVMVLLGMAVIWGSWIGILLCPVLATLLERRFIRPEEDRLRSAFGEEFEDYTRRVRRWL